MGVIGKSHRTSLAVCLTAAVAMARPSPALGEEMAVQLPGGAVMEFVWILPGTFTMGTTDEQRRLLETREEWPYYRWEDQPAHHVTLTRGFWLGKYEVTQEQWRAVMGTNPWVEQDYAPEYMDDPRCAASFLTWDDAQSLAARLNQQAGTAAGVYRLPTEAEWEYACRAGTSTLYWFGDDKAAMADHAWFADNAGDVGRNYAHLVGTTRPSPWGLYDMYGNVAEWVNDWWGPYGAEAAVDPTGPAAPIGVDDGTGAGPAVRALRGGGWNTRSSCLYSASRSWCRPYKSYNTIGVRLVIGAPLPSAVAPTSWGQVKGARRGPEPLPALGQRARTDLDWGVR